MLPLQVQSSFFERLHWLLLGAVGLSALLTIALFWFCRSVPGREGRRGFEVRSLLVSAVAGLTATHILLWNLYFSGDSRSRLDLAVFAICLSAVLLAWQVLRSMTYRGKWFTDGVLSALNLVGFCVCSQLFAVPISISSFPVVPPGLVSCGRHVAYTDKGNEVLLYERDLGESEFREFVRLSRPQISELAKFAMLKSEPMPNTNCHGWVFSQGRFILRNADVDLILTDNEYREVSAPALGDVVVYRNELQEPIHTGRVCGFLDNQVVLVESKWGIDGTYVHAVDKQPYSQTFEFWRSGRASHDLLFSLPEAFRHSKFVADMDD